MKKYIITFLLFLCAAASVTAKDAYRGKIMQLIMPEFSNDIIEKSEESMTQFLIKRDSISERKARKKVKKFVNKNLLPELIDISEKYVRQNMTEAQIDEIITATNSPEADICKEHVKEMLTEPTDSIMKLFMTDTLMLQIMQGKVSKIPLEGIPAEYVAKVKQANSFYDMARPIKRTLQTIFTNVKRSNEVIEQNPEIIKMVNNTISFISNNLEEFVILRYYGHITNADLDWVIQIYSTPAGQAYAKTIESIMDEGMAASTNKFMDFMRNK